MNDATVASEVEQSTSQPSFLPAAVVDYRVQLLDVDNPRGLEALFHQKVLQVWKVLVINDEVVQVVGLLSSSLIDERYHFNN